MSEKCEFAKDCKYYRIYCNVCNSDKVNPYCGIYREFSFKKVKGGKYGTKKISNRTKK